MKNNRFLAIFNKKSQILPFRQKTEKKRLFLCKKRSVAQRTNPPLLSRTFRTRQWKNKTSFRLFFTCSHRIFS